MTQNLSGSQCHLRVKEARRIHESLKSVKASSPRRHSRARGNRESRGGRTQRTCRACATSNQAFVDVIIARKQAPSHRVFVAQVFGRNMCGKRQRRHRFSAFWLRSSVAKCSVLFSEFIVKFLFLRP